jgi:hypothetical protein
LVVARVSYNEHLTAAVRKKLRKGYVDVQGGVRGESIDNPTQVVFGQGRERTTPWAGARMVVLRRPAWGGVGLAAVLLATAATAQGQVTRTTMKIDILPDPSGDDGAEEVLDRLRAGLEGSAADDYELLSLLQPNTLSSRMTRSPAAAVDILSDSGVRTAAGTDFKVTAGGAFHGRIQDSVDAAVGGMDLQSLGTVSVISGEDAELMVEGDIGAASAGAASFAAAQLQANVAGSGSVGSGGDLDVNAGGKTSLAAESLDASLRGDLSVGAAAINLAGSKGLSVVAGEVGLQSSRGARLAAKGAVAELGGDTRIDYVSYVWRSSSSFSTFENTLPEAVAGVVELLVRATPGSAAAVVAGGPTSVAMSLGEAGTGGLSYHTVWDSSMRAGTFSMDGLVIGLDRPYDVAAISLSSAGGDSVYSGWSEVLILLGVSVGATTSVSSASDLEAVAARQLLASAGRMSVGASSDVEVSASSSARVSSDTVDVIASQKMSAGAARMELQASSGIEAFSGGALSGSFGTVSAESRGSASLSASGTVDLSGESAALSLSNDLGLTAGSAKLRADAASLGTSRLSAVAAESASLHTVDAALSASGRLSGYMAAGELMVEGGIAVQSSSDVSARAAGDLLVESASTKLSANNQLSATTGTLKVVAGGSGSGGGGGATNIDIDCIPDASGGCDADAMRAELAALLGVPASRLAVGLA